MTQREPTPEEIATWEAAVEATRQQHPDWSDAEIAGAIAYAVMTPEVQAEVAQHDLDVEQWTAAIRDLQAQHPEWTEQECNDNLINLLAWTEAHPGQELNDDSKPTITETSIASGDVVSGTIDLTADATDNSDLRAIKWYVDGVEVGYDGSGPPFTDTWDTTTVQDGEHTVMVKARDVAGNWGTSRVYKFTVANTPQETA